MKPEYRAFEVRAGDTRTLGGVVVPYGQASSIGGVFNETFEAGSIRYDSVLVNRQHDRSKPLARLGHGLVLENSETELRADIKLPDTVDGRDTYTLVKEGVLKGFSAEFRVKRDTWPDARTRIIHEAVLWGIGVVDDPGHTGAIIDEVRARLQDAVPKRHRVWL